MSWRYWRPRRRTLVDVVADALQADPGDAPPVYLEADLFADDLERYAPTAVEPEQAWVGDGS